LWTICLSWPWTMIILISVSQVARITGTNHHVQQIPFLQSANWTFYIYAEWSSIPTDIHSSRPLNYSWMKPTV
jgi:hypothetical protein